MPLPSKQLQLPKLSFTAGKYGEAAFTHPIELFCLKALLSCNYSGAM